jgi:hypothetical protein
MIGSRAVNEGPFAGPAEASDWPLGTCYVCRDEVFEIAYKHPELNEVLCGPCTKRAALITLESTPDDALDGFEQPERADACRDCGLYRCRCR